MDEPAAHFWRTRARHLAFRHNVGWWLVGFLPVGVGIVLAASALLLACRIAGAVPVWFAPAVATSLLLAAFAAWARQRRRFLETRHALARLDAHLGLYNRLTAAAAGIGAFPPPAAADDGSRWRPAGLLLPVFGSLAVLGAALWMPLTPSVKAPPAVEPPPALGEVGRWVEEIAASETLAPEAARQLDAQIEDLKNRPPEEWYSQAALEAMDGLREQTAAALAAHQRDLAAAQSALATAAAPGADPPPALREQARARFAEALRGLENGALPADRDLLRGLGNVDLARARPLTPEQFEALRQRLERGGQTCAACVGPGREPFDRVAGAGSGREGEGGVQRGPGVAPLGRAPSPTDLRSTGIEALSNPDIARALPAEVLGVARSEPAPNSDPAPPAGATGGAASLGTGGESVARQNLTPAERAALERFFQ